MGTLRIDLDNPENDERLQYVQSTTLNFDREEDFDDVSVNNISYTKYGCCNLISIFEFLTP